MPDSKIQLLTQDDSLGADDVFVVVVDPGGTPADRSVLARRITPRLTTAQMNAVASPQEGDTIYNTDENSRFFYDGADWLSCIDGLPE